MRSTGRVPRNVRSTHRISVGRPLHSEWCAEFGLALQHQLPRSAEFKSAVSPGVTYVSDQEVDVLRIQHAPFFDATSAESRARAIELFASVPGIPPTITQPATELTVLAPEFSGHNIDRFGRAATTIYVHLEEWAEDHTAVPPVMAERYALEEVLSLSRERSVVADQVPGRAVHRARLGKVIVPTWEGTEFNKTTLRDALGLVPETVSLGPVDLLSTAIHDAAPYQ